MLTPGFDVDSLVTDAGVVARVIPGGDLFTLTSRSAVVPAGWVALASRRGRDPVLVRAGERCEDDETSDVLFVRTTPVTCVAAESALRSADGFEGRGTLRLSVRVAQEIGELSAFRRRVIGSGDSLSEAELQQYLYPPMRDVLTSLASRMKAADLLQPLDRSMLRAVVEDKLGACCLAGGITIDSAAAVQFASQAYVDHCRAEADAERRQRHVSARAQIQQALATAQTQRLTHLVGMLERLQDASKDRGDVRMIDLLRTFGEADRGELYAALWHLCPAVVRTRYVAVVSGLELLLFEPPAFDRPARRAGLPLDLGLLRSVCIDPYSIEARVLMVGAATGVHLVDVDTGRVHCSLPANIDGIETIRGGVNAVAMSADHVFATHSQLGLLSWRRENGGCQHGQVLLADVTKGAAATRNACVADMRLWLTADEVLWSLSLSGDEPGEPVRYAGDSSLLSALAVAGGRVYAGDVDGRVIAWDVGEPASGRVVRGQAGGPVESINVVQAGGVDHLVLADRSSALVMMVVGDNCIRRYESGSQAVRRAAAADDLLAAMNDNRDRLIVWRPENPTAPAATVPVGQLTGSTIQDICLVPPAEG